MRIARAMARPAASEIHQTVRPAALAKPRTDFSNDDHIVSEAWRYRSSPGARPLPDRGPTPVGGVDQKRPLAATGLRPRDVPGVATIATNSDAIGEDAIALLERAGYRLEVFQSGDTFLAAEHSVASDCILIDMDVSGADGLNLLKALRSRACMPPVVMLSSASDVREAVTAMKLGAVDFLTKPSLPTMLLEVIGQAVNAGPIRKAAGLDRDATAKVASLPDRQRQVFEGVVQGKSNKIIAYELDISIRTVEAYRAQSLARLNVRGTADAVRLAMAAGVL